MRSAVLADLLDLCDSGVWGNEEPASGMSVLRSTNFRNDGTLNFENLALRAIEPAKRVSKLLSRGDLLLEKSGGGPSQPVGRVVLFNGDGLPHTFGNFIARLRPKSLVVSEYLWYYLRYFHSLGKTSHYQKQTTGIRNLEFKRYLSIQVPLRQLDEQRCIVDLLSRAEGIVRLRREAQQKAAELIPAIFIDMFGDPTTNPLCLPTHRVSDIVARFEGGKNLQAGDAADSALRILKVSAVTSGTYREAECKPTPNGYVPPKNHFVQAGDLLFSRANTVELVGATAVVETTNGKTLLPDKLWRFVWRQDIDVGYMHALFQTPAIRRELSKLASGTSDSMRNISQAKLFDLRLPIADVAQQRRFGRLSRSVRSVMAQQVEAMAKATATFDSLLSRTFG